MRESTKLGLSAKARRYLLSPQEIRNCCLGNSYLDYSKALVLVDTDLFPAQDTLLRVLVFVATVRSTMHSKK